MRQYVRRFVKITIEKFVLALAIIGLLGVENTAQADPIGDFFKRLGRSISNNGKRQQAHRTDAQKSSNTPDTEPHSAEIKVTPSASASPPNQISPSVRTALAVPDAKNSKRDAPFGIPVPGKKGFVTSPFSPDGNFVDVHAFPPGAEVKDPYTGKIFRVP
jgi:hypothetical protein